jgi:hypothetical protein
MEARRDDGLTAKQARFAALLAQGWTQAAAYREAYNTNGAKPETVWQEASRLAHDPRVSARVRELLENARIEDIDSPQVAFRALLQDIEAARADRNWSAVMAGHDKRLKVWGMLKERHIQENVESMSDEQLIRELAGDDPEKRKLLADMIGADYEDDGEAD